MGTHEAPHTILGTGFETEALLESTVGLVGGDDGVLVDGVWAGHLLLGQYVTLIKHPDIGHHQA